MSGSLALCYGNHVPSSSLIYVFDMVFFPVANCHKDLHHEHV